MLKKYSNFKEYMEDNFCDEIFDAVKGLVAADKDSFEDEEITHVHFVELQDIHVEGVTFKETENDELEIRVTADSDVEVKGKAGRDYDSFSRNRMYNVFFRGKLEDASLQNMRVVGKGKYSPNEYIKEISLSQSLIPYMYEEDVEKYAEDFLKRRYPKALLQPMTLPVEEIAKSMGMKIFFAPLEDGIFGKTYFDEETVVVYDNITGANPHEVLITPGTMLINPNVYFIYNIGTANNTIIHECVHWDRHKRAFELEKLLSGKSSHISCEIVEEKYNGISEDAPALKWMEWQANQLAPRILMPAEMTKKVFNTFVREAYQKNPRGRYAEHLQEAVERLSMFFQVSIVAAKIRVIELGCDQAQGTFVYCDGKYMPPFSFTKGSLRLNETFIIDEQNLVINLATNPKLLNLYMSGAVVYANNMLCLNSPKYIEKNEVGKDILTVYALDHVDECCYIFNRSVSASNTYSDTFYRRCFLCREIDSSSYIAAEYNPDHKINQSKEKMQDEIDIIMKQAQMMALKMTNDIPSGFAGTLNYHMERKKISAEELSGRSNVSTVSISGYRNNIELKIEPGTALALCKGLYLENEFAEDFMKKAGYALDVPTPSRMFVKLLIRDHMDDTWEQWIEKIQMAGIAKEVLPTKYKKIS